MPKQSVARKLLYEKWFLTIQFIDQSINPKNEIMFYLKKKSNLDLSKQTRNCSY